MAVQLEGDARVRRDVVRLGCLTTENVVLAAQAVERLDAAAARQVIKGDERIDELRFALDERLIQTLSSPAQDAQALREAVAAFRICLEIERVGDSAVSIAKAMIKLTAQQSEFLHPATRHMSDACIEMLKGATDAYVNRDSELACVVSKRDDEVDAWYSEILTAMSQRREHAPNACVQNVLIARAYERMADHITNVCEWIMFEKTGVHQELN